MRLDKNIGSFTLSVCCAHEKRCLLFHIAVFKQADFVTMPSKLSFEVNSIEALNVLIAHRCLHNFSARSHELHYIFVQGLIVLVCTLTASNFRRLLPQRRNVPLISAICYHAKECSSNAETCRSPSTSTRSNISYHSLFIQFIPLHLFTHRHRDVVCEGPKNVRWESTKIQMLFFDQLIPEWTFCFI